MPALPKEMVPVLLATGASARVAEAVAGRYRAGDAVLARNLNPVGHTRLPRYIRGKRGVVRADHGVFSFPDTMAHGLGHKAQHLYSVRFMARELWGELASPHDSVYIDLFDDYLDPDPGAMAGAAAAAAGVPDRASARASRRSARPKRGRASTGKTRKARRPGVRLQKKTGPEAAAPARGRRQSAAEKKTASVGARPAKPRKAPAKPARPRKAGKKTRIPRS